MSSLRVLLVGNGSAKSESVSTTLGNANHMVLSANGLEEACEALSLEQFDAVLLASNFPAPNLAAFAAKLRDMEKNQRAETHIPLLALESVSPEGVDGSISEPVEAEALTTAVKNLASAVANPVEQAEGTAIENLPVLEAEKFEEQVGYDNELMVEIIDLFLAESQKDIAAITTHLENRAWETLAKGAHTLKGSLGSLHASRARARAQALESSANDKLAERSTRAFTQLLQDLEALEPKLLELKETVTSTKA